MGSAYTHFRMQSILDFYDSSKLPFIQNIVTFLLNSNYMEVIFK